jgi:hypothetical protein
MIFAAIGVGLMTAYYFGVQAGIWAAAGTAGLMIAAVVPALKVYAYAVLGVGVAGVAYFGPRMRRPGSPAGVLRFGQDLARRYAGKLFASKPTAPRPRTQKRR